MGSIMAWLQPRLAGLVAVLSLACAAISGSSVGGMPIPVYVRSHNGSTVDVYLLCGDQNAVWLGEVSAKGAAGVDIPAGHPYCIRGLNFFLVLRSSGRGYWAGPVRPVHGELVELVIEKYAGLSIARVVRGGQ